MTKQITKEAQQSLFDFLVDLMPDLQITRIRQGPSAEEKKLFSVWSDTANKITGKKFHRPPTMSEVEVAKLENAGLIQVQGRSLRVTDKGAKAIQQIILSEEKSVFEKSSSRSGHIKTASYQTMTDEEREEREEELADHTPSFAEYVNSQHDNKGKNRKASNWYQHLKNQ
tara:strand:- start:69176 stop:69685 length:510 start_codon:yes stop_codon:yes gene_type:complete